MDEAQMKQEEEQSRLRLEHVHEHFPVVTGSITQNLDDQRLDSLWESDADGTKPLMHGSSSMFKGLR
jgi:hypothetical protein